MSSSNNQVVKKIDELQHDIVNEFKCLQSNQDAKLLYIIELGEKMRTMSALGKIDHNLVYGCVSKVWIAYTRKQDRIIFEGDSDASITKGLLSILIKIFSNQNINDIIAANLFFIQDIGLLNLIGQQRSFGLASVIKQIKMIAIAQKSKVKGRKRNKV